MKNVHLLPTDKPSRLFIDIEDNKLKITIPIGGEHMMNQNIYITNDEEIKEGDYCTSHLNIIDEGKIHNSQTIFNPKTKEHLILLQSCKKIILTTDTDLIKEGVQAIDDEFLIWLVKNSNCEEVEVKTRYLHYYKTGETFISFSKTPDFSSRNMQCIKIEPRYEIIIPKEEPKQENSEDFGLPKVGTKEFNDLASGLFGGKPKQEKLTYTESAKKEERISNCTMITVNKKTLEEAAEILIKLNRQDAFYEGAKWQQEKQADFVIGFLEFIEGTYSYSNIFDHWYLHADTSKTYSKKQLLEVYLKRNKL